MLERMCGKMKPHVLSVEIQTETAIMEIRIEVHLKTKGRVTI